ncbi:ParB/RepB/Spo0J family partition protein [Gordonibacter sp. An230]|uniref:ParB/RepB/Spo0J family partition protein n=1 Tax=Gordonibacter sp. An230 TaxID=1965592 RepID=UPI0013A61C19|nr:ParB/RepB/Spo0J family partition protein [Gordonibacter sp. An230]
MELREIPVEDVYPDEKNPRKDFGDIAALAESCMLNAISPGEPVNPIVVVADGGIYRIVDGERRYKAMKMNKLKRCHAVVCEDLDEANSLVAMVATDDKQQLSEIERSRGVQQMLLLGVDPERVERVGRMPKGSAARLRRARAAVDDAGDDMTLDRMLAIAEFEEAGDAEAVERLASCREAEWSAVARSIREERETAEKTEALRRACAEAGIALEEDVPGYEDGYVYRTSESRPSAVAEAFGRLPEGSLAWLCEKSYGGPEVRFYWPVNGAADPDAERRAELAHEAEGMIKSGAERRLRWFARTVADADACPNVRGMLLDSFFDESRLDSDPTDKLERFVERAGIAPDIPRALSGAMAAYLYETENGELPLWYARNLVDGGRLREWEVGYAERWLRWLNTCCLDGYKADEADEALADMVDDALATAREEEE